MYVFLGSDSETGLHCPRWIAIFPLKLFLCAIFCFFFLSLCLYRSAVALCVFLLYDFISGLLWCFECFDLLIYHVVRCTAFIYINRCMGFLLLQIKLFAFQSVTLKVYRPYVLVCFQTSVATFNLILTPLHLRLRRRISSQKWMNKLEFFLQKQHIEWILDMLCLLKRN